MTGILGSVSNLIGSILDVFASIFNALLSGVQSVFAVAGTLVSDVVGLAEGFVGFILGNIVIIGLLIVAFVGYSAYQQKSGRTVAGKTK